jgi:hypothetical protein
MTTTKKKPASAKKPRVIAKKKVVKTAVKPRATALEFDVAAASSITITNVMSASGRATVSGTSMGLQSIKSVIILTPSGASGPLIGSVALGIGGGWTATFNSGLIQSGDTYTVQATGNDGVSDVITQFDFVCP